MRDDKTLFSLTSEVIASSAGAWADLASVTPQQVTNLSRAYLGGFSTAAIEFRLVQGRSSNGPWLVYQDPVLSLSADVNAENDGVIVDLGFSWVKLQYKSSASATVTLDVVASEY